MGMEPTLNAEQTLLMFVSALQHLEGHKRRVVEQCAARKFKIVKTKALIAQRQRNSRTLCRFGFFLCRHFRLTL